MHYWPTWQDMWNTLPPADQAELYLILDAATQDDAPQDDAP